MANWTKKELTYLINNYNESNIGYLAKILDRTEYAVSHKAYRLGLKRSDLSDLNTILVDQLEKEAISEARHNRSGYKKALDFSKSLGYRNVSQAVDKLGGYNRFMSEYSLK